MKKSFSIILALVLAALLSEGFLRLTIPFEIMFQTWFTRGAHTPDDSFGLVYTKNYQGYMRHADGVWNIPLTLDENGFRRPQFPRSGQNGTDIVMIGGASIIFCYGLPDERTIAAHMVRNARMPVTVHNAAWPGLDLYTNFHVYKRLLEPQAKPRLAILNFWGTTADSFARLPEDGNYDQVKRAGKKESLFRHFPDLSVAPSGKMATLAGGFYYASYIGAGLVSFFDKAIDTAVRIRRYTTAIAHYARPNPPLPGKSGEKEKGNLVKFHHFIEYLDLYFRERNCLILLNFLPCGHSRDFYRELKSAVPSGVPLIDLHEALHDQFAAGSNYIALNHYNDRAARIVGEKMATCMSPLLPMGASLPSR
jgi:hypothetical protein